MDLPIYPRCHQDGRHTAAKADFRLDIDFKTDHLLFHGGVEKRTISNELKTYEATSLIASAWSRRYLMVSVPFLLSFTAASGRSSVLPTCKVSRGGCECETSAFASDVCDLKIFLVYFGARLGARPFDWEGWGRLRERIQWLTMPSASGLLGRCHWCQSVPVPWVWKTVGIGVRSGGTFLYDYCNEVLARKFLSSRSKDRSELVAFRWTSAAIRLSPGVVQGQAEPMKVFSSGALAVA